MWEQPMTAPCQVTSALPAPARTAADVIGQRTLWGAEGCRAAARTRPAHADACTAPPLETWHLGTGRNFLFLINRFPDTKYQFVFATIGGRLCNRKNFLPVPLAGQSCHFGLCLKSVCSPRSCSTAVTATENSKQCFLTLSFKYPFPPCRSTKQ